MKAVSLLFLSSLKNKSDHLESLFTKKYPNFPGCFFLKRMSTIREKNHHRFNDDNHKKYRKKCESEIQYWME